MTGDRLKDSVAVVTGGSTGIGYGCAAVLGRAGVHVVITARTEADGKQAEAELTGLGLSVIYMPQDVALEADWERVTSETLQRLGRLDFLINNAGISHLSPIEETPAEDLMALVRVNLIGAYYGFKHCVPLIVEAYDKRGYPGMVVDISSILSRIGQDGASAYCSTKGGMAGLNRAYGRMLAGQEHKIQVKSLLPGYTMTPQVDKAIGRDSPLVDQLAQTIPLRRWAEPEEVGETLLMMLDPLIQLEDREVIADGGCLAS
jgi:NAD(P)-dependent dehydrogenase (short-subunit alcohol dehydrogenase family)